MRRSPSIPLLAASAWPDPWRMAVIAIASLILCSCRSPAGAQRAALPVGQSPHHSPADVAGDPSAGPVVAASATMLPFPEWQGPVEKPWCPSSCPVNCPPPSACPTGPWPEDEYLRDGGDGGKPIGVGGNREVLGLKMEDAVAHYDTLDGRILVEPSNEVYLYSPRFGSVRKVVSLQAEEDRKRLGGITTPERVDVPTIVQSPVRSTQNLQPGDQAAATPVVAMRSRQGDGAMSTAIGPRAFQDRFRSYENLSIIRLGAFEASETAILARGADAAIAWSHHQAVQVILDRRGAMAEVKYDAVQRLYTVDTPPGHPRLRLVKLASTPCAKPGEEVAFTLRFDNVGDEPIGHVTILDSLSTRLELIPESVECSLAAEFSSHPNEGHSVVVRCEVQKPLEPGQGGILRFRCRVR